jgi:hypothetical protein
MLIHADSKHLYFLGIFGRGIMRYFISHIQLIWADRRYNVAPIIKLAASVADDKADKKRTEKQWTKCQRFVKLKELQADTQANAFAAHLILPNRTQNPPTTRQVDSGQFGGNF